MQALTTARSPHRYVEGFEYYAARRHGASSLDLTLWSILNGSCEGAYQLWTLSTAPLRLSLLGQEVCRRKLDEGVPPRKASELQELLDRLKDGAAGILDYVESQEDARMVLCSVDGPYAVLGSSGSEGLSILDLAIQMANGVGLLKRLEPVVKQHELHPGFGRIEKIAFSKKHFAA
jgi:hypothetical protein